MINLELEISKIKNISKAKMELSLDKGIYGIIGSNGCGKSTILTVLAQLIRRYYLGNLQIEDFNYDSYVSFSVGLSKDIWTYSKNKKQWFADSYPSTIQYGGMYEGSLFYGTRFDESKIVDDLVKKNKFNDDEIVDADDFVQKQLSYILHGDFDHYKDIKKVKNKHISKRLGLKNTPYFTVYNDNLISQYRMSSGECLLLSLLHFIYNSVIRRSLKQDKPVLLLIDEIELALHPIAVSRLIDLLDKTVNDSDSFVVYLTSHSPEVIRKIQPSKLYKIENNMGKIDVVNPCYPSYAIRDVYSHDGYDYLLLVEDELAKKVVDRVLLNCDLRISKLIHIVPVGGWTNVLSLHHDLISNNVLGINKEIISILDGDIINEANRKENYKSLKKLFLPIKSVEKYIYKICIEEENSALKKNLSDRYFQLKSLNILVKEFKSMTFDSRKDKNFYKYIMKDLLDRKITESDFITHFVEDIFEDNLVDFSAFTNKISNMIR